MRYYILLFISALMLSGCSIMDNYDNSCTDNEAEDEFINITFRLVSPTGTISRADDIHDEIDSENPQIEDRIYGDDFCFFLFAGDAEGDPAFVTKVDSGTETTDPHTSISGGPVTFTVKMSVPKSDFESIVPSTVENVTFRIVALANTNKKFADLNPTQYSTFNSLITTASDWNFSIFNMIYSGTGGMRSNPKIPMFGTEEFTISRTRLYKSRPDDPVRGEDLHLLRSLAKIKVIDNIPEHDENGFPRIDEVTFTGYPTAYILPYDAAGYVNGKQIETPRPCESVNGSQVDTRELNLNRDGQNNNCLFGYIPEQFIRTENPVIKIVVKFSENIEDRRMYTIPMTEYNGQPFSEFGEAILRNHIYTLRVDRADYAEARIAVSVEDWTPRELSLDYSEIPNISQKLEWDSGSYSSYDPNLGNVVLKPRDADQYTPLTGTFKLAGPVGATWTAFLLTTAGTPNTILFLEEFVEGDWWPVNSVSGTITGDLEKDNFRLHIFSGVWNPTELNSAKLQIMISLGNNTNFEVALTPESSDFTNFTIIQNPLL